MARRKKKKIEKKKIGLEELAGFKAGQNIYCYRYPDKQIAKGTIIRLFSNTDDFAEFIDEVSGQFRATLLEDIIDNPTRAQISSINTKISWKKRDKKKSK